MPATYSSPEPPSRLQRDRGRSGALPLVSVKAYGLLRCAAALRVTGSAPSGDASSIARPRCGLAGRADGKARLGAGTSGRRAPASATDASPHVSAASTVRRQPPCSTATTLASLGLRRSVWACAACSAANLSGCMVPSSPMRLTTRHVAPVLPSSGAGWRSSTS